MKRAILMIPILTTSTLAYSAEEEPQPPYWKGGVELGSVATSGNTNTKSTNAKFHTKRKGLEWDFGYRLEALSSEEDGEKSKEKYYTVAQFDRNFTEHSYLAIRTDYDNDRFSGYDYQATASIGLGYRLLNSTSQELDVEAAPGYRRDKVEDGPREDEGMVRLTGHYRWKIQEGTSLIQHLETELSENNKVYKSETGLQSQINGHLATKLTYSVEYTDTVPEDTEKKDSEFSVTLVYSF